MGRVVRRAGHRTRVSPVQSVIKQDRFFSVIIPTMWRSNKILQMLSVYESSKYVKEVIIIDNDPKLKPNLSNFSKIKYHTKGVNLFVNPSWNLGVSLASYEKIIANDDVLIYDLDDVLNLIQCSDFDILGICINDCGEELKIEEIKEFPQESYGCFMYVKNYTYIPEQFKIWRGDLLLFDHNNKKGIIKGLKIKTEKSTTVNLFRDSVCIEDVKEFDKFKNPDTLRLNIIIRTSGRPVYFQKCIDSIKEHCPSAILHITVDEVDDLKYIKDCGLPYKYYVINRETVKEICKNIQITRPAFIYNYYFNIVKPFLNGWCLFLDDDDELVETPKFGKNEKDIYLHKADVGSRVVPSNTNFGKKPIINDISGISIIFHSSQMIDWKPERGGDFNFITAMYDKCNPVWIDKILAKTQTFGNFGKRNDLKEKNKIAVCIPMWKRPEITSFVFNHYKQIKEELKDEVDILLIAVGSEGAISRSIAENNGFIYEEYPNDPLSQKANKMYETASKYNPDACIKIDSDSIVSIEFFKWYNKLINEGCDYAGVLDIYFLTKDYICYWSGYKNERKGVATGVGRFLSKNLLNKLNWRPYGDVCVNRVLDGNMQRCMDRFIKTPLKKVTTTCEEQNGMIFDIKSDISITNIESFEFDLKIPTNYVNLNMDTTSIKDYLNTLNK